MINSAAYIRSLKKCLLCSFSLPITTFVNTTFLQTMKKVIQLSEKSQKLNLNKLLSKNFQKLIFHLKTK